MRTIRLLTTLLLVALCTGFSSCGGDDFESTPTTSVDTDNLFDKTNKYFAEYLKDYSNITCRGYLAGENTVSLSGIKNKHLWFSEFDTSTKNLKSEWTDIEETDTIQKVYKGYGEYETIYIRTALPTYYKKTSTGNIVTFTFGYSGRTIFTSNNKSKRTPLQINYTPIPNDWYKESVFISDCCYSHEGDTIYVAKEKPYFEDGKIDAELISYEDGIKLSNNSISRYSYKEAKSIWGTSITPPFDISSDAKRNYSLLDSTTNVWEYKCDVTFYDGTKKDFTFKINIDNGTIIANVTGVTLNELEKELDLNETFQLEATIMPDNANNKNITWSSSNETVASVNKNGLVTPKSIGATTITATTEDGRFTASCAITVKMKQDINAYIETKVVPDGNNLMGMFLGILNCTITNNSSEQISLESMIIINGDGTTIFSKQYDDKIINPKDYYLEGVQGLPAIYEPTVKWTYKYNGTEYTISKTYKK